MNEVIQNFSPWVEILENAIRNDAECPSSFEKRFCDDNELIDVWFSSKKMKVVYLLSSGEFQTNEFDLKEFSDWLDE